ncbi:MAG: hypothetical protein KDB53_11365 [Planctomycetes bacterium]|nr:hypothetical protein [Planctomycetota bacterium]
MFEKQRVLFAVLLMFASLVTLRAQDASTELATLKSIPAREVMIFKDGHAFVVHEGEVTLDARGCAVLGELPKPVLGTFWPAVLNEGMVLEAAVAGTRELASNRPAGSMLELVDVNAGATVTVTQTDDTSWVGTLVDQSPAKASQLGYFLAQTSSGLRVVPTGLLREITFHGDLHREVDTTVNRQVLELQIRGTGAVPGAKVRIAIAYLQKGIDWIPSYRVDLDGKGEARLELRASISNDLVDLTQATAHLVVGVPSFPFAHMTDPIALDAAFRHTAAQMPANSFVNPAYSNAASNFINTQVADFGGAPGVASGSINDEIAGEAQGLEDLFIHSLKGVTLAKGERMSRLIAKQRLNYEDVYVLDVPVVPLNDLQHRNGGQMSDELERLINRPKAEHRIRLTNDSSLPITTAPALVFRDGRLVAQSQTRFTPAGAKTDLALTAAIEIQVDREDRETGRQNGALTLGRTVYHQVDLESTVRLVNRTKKAVKVEVVRQVFGHVDAAMDEGEVTRLSMLRARASSSRSSDWWTAVSWPHWWSQVNGVSRVTWERTLEPGEASDFRLTSHYFWN